jgi:hypothetical protein
VPDRKRQTLRGRWFGLRFRVANAARDLVDRLRGRCCAAPRYMVDGGYHFWRCGLRRRHAGPHRSGHYLWGPGGSVYDPSKWADLGKRHPAETRRQRRSRRDWHALADAKREIADAQGAFKEVDRGDY